MKLPPSFSEENDEVVDLGAMHFKNPKGSKGSKTLKTHIKILV